MDKGEAPLPSLFSDEISLRAFSPADRPEIRRIACATAFLETRQVRVFDDDEVLADALTAYYTDNEPEGCFVAVSEGRVVGYIFGSADVRRMARVMNTKILPWLFLKALVRGVFFRRVNRPFFRGVGQSWLKGEFRIPCFNPDYPAVLHINMEKDFRAHGWGMKLMEHYLGYLKANRVRGVHCGTLSENARRFFEKAGFRVLFQGRRSCLQYHAGHPVPYYILGKKLL